MDSLRLAFGSADNARHIARLLKHNAVSFRTEGEDILVPVAAFGTCVSLLRESGWTLPKNGELLDEALKPLVAAALKSSFADLPGFDRWNEETWNGLALEADKNPLKKFRSVRENYLRPLVRYLLENPGMTLPFYMDTTGPWKMTSNDQRQFSRQYFRETGKRKAVGSPSEKSLLEVLKADGYVTFEVSDKGEVIQPTEALIKLLKYMKDNGVGITVPSGTQEEPEMAAPPLEEPEIETPEEPNNEKPEEPEEGRPDELEIIKRMARIESAPPPTSNGSESWT